LAGICRSGTFDPDGSHEPIYGTLLCTFVGCSCKHYTTLSVESVGTRCTKCHHTRLQHGVIGPPFDHIIACDEYKMELPLDAHLFTGITKSNYDDWSGRITLVRDFPYHVEREGWRW